MDFTVFPIYSIQFQLNTLSVADLVEQSGYYQIRFRFKKCPEILDYQLSVVPKLEHQQNSSSSSADRRAATKAAIVENSLNGYSSALLLTRNSKLAEFDDCFHCRLRLTKRLDKMDAAILVPIQLELWAHCSSSPATSSSSTSTAIPPSPPPPSLNHYRFLAHHQAQLLLWPNQGTHCSRHVHFDCSVLETPVMVIQQEQNQNGTTTNANGVGAAGVEMTSISMVSSGGTSSGFFTLALTVHAAICSFRVVRQRQKGLTVVTATTATEVPNGAQQQQQMQNLQPISPKLAEMHDALLSNLLSSVLSLQLFIQRHQHVLQSPLKLDLLNVTAEKRRLQRELQQSAVPTEKLEEQLRDVGTRLSRVFTQLLQLFTNSKALNDSLLREFDQQRTRQLAEAFLASEQSVRCLLRPDTHFYQSPQPQVLLQVFKTENYLKYAAQLPIFVDGLDSRCEEMAIILERSYLPVQSTSNNPFLPKFQISADEPRGNGHESSTVASSSSSRNQDRGAEEADSRNVNEEKEEAEDEDGKGQQGHSCWPKQCLNLTITSANLEKRRMANPSPDYAAHPPPASARETTTKGPATGREEKDRDAGNEIIKYTLLDGLRMKVAHSMSELSKFSGSSSRGSSPARGAPPPKPARAVHASVSSEESTTSSSRSSSQKVPLLTASQRSFSDATLTGGTNSNTLESSNNGDEKGSTKTHRRTTNDNDQQDQMLEFVHRKEAFRRQLRQACPQHDICLHSDSTQLQRHRLLGGGSLVDADNILRRRAIYEQTHLIVLVHGLEGSSDDLTAYRNHLRLELSDRNLVFLQSTINQLATWTSVERMAENLLGELLEFIEEMPISEQPARISFVAHSLGGLIVRALCSLPDFAPLLPRLHTLMTLNSPHCGLLFNQRAANWGLSLFQWWKQSACLEQLMLQDALDLRKTCIYRLSTNGAFAHFKTVLLVGSSMDLYVPCHSALVEQCKQALHEPNSRQSQIYSEMLDNISRSIVDSPKRTQLIKYTIIHNSLPNVPRLQQVTGRAVHVATIDNDNLVERLMSISAAAYFK